MFVNHAPRNANRLAAALRTRESICADAPPGSWVWNQYGCGTSATSAPSPSPAPPSVYAPAPPAPPASTQAPTIVYDESAARAAQDAANARILAEQQAAREAAARAASDDAARLASDEARRAKAEAAAAADAAMMASGSGGAMFSTFAPSSGNVEFDASTLTVPGDSSNSSAMLILAALAGVGVLVMLRKRRR